MKYNELFPGRTFFPVIRVNDYRQAVMNVLVALGCEVKGVFLINGVKIADQELVKIYVEIKRIIAKTDLPLWVGLNLLRTGLNSFPENTFKLLPSDVDGVWLDRMQIDPGDPFSECAKRVQREHRNYVLRSEKPCLLFGSFAFKGQEYVREQEYPEYAPRVCDYADALVTSGPRTSKPPSVSKIVAIRKAIGPEAPLLIASGTTAENVNDYPEANGFLVATGINKPDSDDIDVGRLLDYQMAIGEIQSGD